MTIHYSDDTITLHHGDCVAVLATLAENSIDAIVTDPPYGLEFMGKEWDAPWQAGKGIGEHNAGFSQGAPAVPGVRGAIKSLPNYTGSTNPTCRNCGGTRNGNDRASRKACRCDAPSFPNTTLPRMQAFQLWCQEWATECLRVLKPGGHLLAFGGTRTWHRLACAVEDAGFELRDSIAWLYGSGFPKSLDVSKAIDKAAGAEREVIGYRKNLNRTAKRNEAAAFNSSEGGMFREDRDTFADTAPATDAARQWQGWGTALKPSFEGIVCATKPRPAQGILGEIGSHLNRLESEWSSIANHAGLTFGPTRPGSPAVNPDSVHGNAATPPEVEAARPTATGLAAGSRAATDTSASESMVETFWNIATSWKHCLAELSELMSTSTTETTSVTTTGLRTLSSSISSLTATNTLHHETSPAGLTPLASAVDSLFGAALLNWRAIHALSVVEPATAPTRRSRQGAAASAFEPIVMARKPIQGTVAANVQQRGTGAINIDGCRIGDNPGYSYPNGAGGNTFTVGGEPDGSRSTPVVSTAGRWPANVALDTDMAAVLDQQSGTRTSGKMMPTKPKGGRAVYGQDSAAGYTTMETYGDTGGASRFYFVAKAPSSERPKVDGEAHATVKPLDLMRWLIRLVTPSGGVVLDCFAGSGTTLEAAGLEGFRAVGIEREADYLPLIMQRIRQTPIALFDDGEAS